MPVLIGKDRRITLLELQSLAQEQTHLEWSGEEVEASNLDLTPLAKTDVAMNEDECLNREETIAVLTILALHISSDNSQKEAGYHLTRLVNLIIKHQITELPKLSRNPSDASQPLSQYLAVDLTKDFLNRVWTLALNGLAFIQAIELAQVYLPVAALSVDVSGHANTLITTSYAETTIANRPHRSIVQAAVTLRTLLNSSRYTPEGKEDTVPNVLVQLPQYYGPALDLLQEACKTWELELNSRVEGTWDDTLTQSVQQKVELALTILVQRSRERQGAIASVETSDLRSILRVFQAVVTEEAKNACVIIQRVHDEQVGTMQAKHSDASQATASTEDEFAGMTEAQKEKILKKRAEKEAKRKAKESKKTSSLFGAGIAPLLEILQAHQMQLTPACRQQILEKVNTLMSGGLQRTPKIPLGTRDYLPEQMMIRQQAFSIIRRVFAAHGAVEIDTPVFELKETLTGKYGEDSKLIYDLADQGGELLALRYDLTVPFARFLAKNSVGNIKRFHIGKVYRRDRPVLAKGRYREFYQCDFDIAGTYARMLPDSECVCVACEILDELPIGDFGIKLNHRRLLDAILDLCGVPAEKFRTICSAVDKLDKEPWEEVKREMVEDKGLEGSVADQIGEYVLNKGNPWDMHKELMDSGKFSGHQGAMEAMEDLRLLFEYLEAMDKLKFITFDLSLARGLDYYTGVIYEAVCMSGTTQVGSIGGGGRYDNLVSMFQESGKQTPCVGVSVGIERVFTLMEKCIMEEKGSIKQRNVDVLISSAGSDMLKEKMKIARILWDAKISAEYTQTENARLKKELPTALDRGLPFMVIVGETELKDNKVTVKDLNAKIEEQVLISELVSYLRGKGLVPVGCEFAAELLTETTSL